MCIIEYRCIIWAPWGPYVIYFVSKSYLYLLSSIKPIIYWAPRPSRGAQNIKYLIKYDI